MIRRFCNRTTFATWNWIAMLMIERLKRKLWKNSLQLLKNSLQIVPTKIIWSAFIVRTALIEPVTWFADTWCNRFKCLRKKQSIDSIRHVDIRWKSIPNLCSNLIWILSRRQILLRDWMLPMQKRKISDRMQPMKTMPWTYLPNPPKLIRQKI